MIVVLVLFKVAWFVSIGCKYLCPTRSIVSCLTFCLNSPRCNLVLTDCVEERWIDASDYAPPIPYVPPQHFQNRSSTSPASTIGSSRLPAAALDQTSTNTFVGQESSKKQNSRRHVSRSLPLAMIPGPQLLRVCLNEQE
jgi:hypothetical protein